MTLSSQQIERFSRQLLLPDVGRAGQERLLSASVAVAVGTDPASEHVALAYLTAAGVGRIVLLADDDSVISQREVRLGFLFRSADVGQPRIPALRQRLLDLFPDVVVNTVARGDEVTVEMPPASAQSITDGLWRGGSAALDTLFSLTRAP